jgi:hypothetical protein
MFSPPAFETEQENAQKLKTNFPETVKGASAMLVCTWWAKIQTPQES